MMKLFAASAGLVQNMCVYAPLLCILTDFVYSILKIKNKSTTYKLLICKVIGWPCEKLLKTCTKLRFLWQCVF